jgi:uncharacterized membrane protein
MISSLPSSSTIASAWEVLVLFIIPIGGGIPAGVLLAKARHFNWQTMLMLYFISDLILAVLFEPILHLSIALSKKSAAFSRFVENMKRSMRTTTAAYGTTLGPFALILLAFGVDPMTGRAAAVAAGHGFLTGWALAISGDMLYFSVLMVSTLWLNNILGDGTWTTVIILVAMMVVPWLVKLVRKKETPPPGSFA